jgi:hypothetical protein
MTSMRMEQRLLPHMGEISTPSVDRRRIEEWRRRPSELRMEDARSFAAAWRAKGVEGVRAHPWWDVLSNLSVARFAIEEEE